MESVRAFLDAAQAFFSSLAEVRFEALGIAVLLHALNLTLRTRAWLNILRAAYPDSLVRWRSVIGAYFAGVGINAFAPARGGDLVKLYALRQRIAHSTTPTLVATLLAETVFDFFVASGLLIWAYASGRLPHLPDIPHAPAFEWSFVARHTREVEIGAVVLLFLAAIGVRWLAHHVRAFWQRVRQGLAILQTPRVFVRRVVLFQACGWVCRMGTAYYMLRAFHVHTSIQNALLVLVVGSISTLLPITPGGAGAQQALLALVLAGAASQTTVLAYSVGNQAIVTIVNVVLGVTAMLVMFRGLHWKQIAASARREPPTPTPESAPPG